MKSRTLTCITAITLFAALGISRSAQAQTFTTLHSFDYTDGYAPDAGLIQATDGNLYGTTDTGGANGFGTAFKITPNGTLTTLYNFCSQSGCTDGKQVPAGLVQATNGNIYGTTQFGGTSTDDYGTVFKITPSGTLTTLYSFCPEGGNCTDGAIPDAGLVQATDGNFYGTMQEGGVADNGDYGTVFKITPSGTLTTLYSFCSQSNCTDGSQPFAGLVQATDGNFYGTTIFGGAHGAGTVFKITPSGTLTVVYSFCSQVQVCGDGANPEAGLIQGIDGDLYGTTVLGGANFGGTVFKITLSGTLTTLYTFCSLTVRCTDGGGSVAGLIQATDGNFYGTTTYGGSNETACGDFGCGTVFKITSSGRLTTLYSFCSQSGCTDGETPNAALVQDTNGTLYGTTELGGTSDACFGGSCGTVFSLSVGLRPFVEPQTTSGKVGAAVKILGSDLTGATSVTFNGTAATFTVFSRSVIGATVPEGATSGTVEVTTPHGTLKSNVPFHVRP